MRTAKVKRDAAGEQRDCASPEIANLQSSGERLGELEAPAKASQEAAGENAEGTPRCCGGGHQLGRGKGPEGGLLQGSWDLGLQSGRAGIAWGGPGLCPGLQVSLTASLVLAKHQN